MKKEKALKIIYELIIYAEEKDHVFYAFATPNEDEEEN